MKHLFYCVVALLLSFLASCVGYSKYPIMRTPNLKVDENLFGMWKAVGDTNIDNFFLIQKAYDKYYTVDKVRKGYGSVENWLLEFEKNFSKDYPSTDVDTQGNIIRMLHQQTNDMFNNDYY